MEMLVKGWKNWWNLRDLSCLLLCSLLLKARAQYWHLYFLSAVDCLRTGDEALTPLVAVVFEGGMVGTMAGSREPSANREKWSNVGLIAHERWL